MAFGDLLTRGPWVCREYLYRGAEGGAAPEGWFATGDVATIDPNGYVELVDRSKDVIKSGGEWISSIVLENIAVSHPDVAEAAVINARHERWQERPLLLVVPRGGRTIDIAGLMKLYDGAVAKWWLPDAVVVVDELPHGATGKLNKLALRQEGPELPAGEPLSPTASGSEQAKGPAMTHDPFGYGTHDVPEPGPRPVRLQRLHRRPRPRYHPCHLRRRLVHPPGPNHRPPRRLRPRAGTRPAGQPQPP